MMEAENSRNNKQKTQNNQIKTPLLVKFEAICMMRETHSLYATSIQIPRKFREISEIFYAQDLLHISV